MKNFLTWVNKLPLQISLHIHKPNFCMKTEDTLNFVNGNESHSSAIKKRSDDISKCEEKKEGFSSTVTCYSTVK